MNPTIECACGCGQTLLKYDGRGRERSFIHNHHARLQSNNRSVLNCEECGKVIVRPNWHRERVQHHFCNHECEGKWSSRHGRRRGSSNGHYNTLTVPCAGCAAPVSRAMSLINRRNNRVYCPACTESIVRRGRTGFYVGYPAEFSSALRKAIRTRDEHTCQNCGKHSDRVGTLHVHHIDYNKLNNDRLNLISLCRVCHGQTNFAPEIWQPKLTALIQSIPALQAQLS